LNERVGVAVYATNKAIDHLRQAIEQDKKELEATERQVEILTDELANAQRRIEQFEQAQKQEPVAECIGMGKIKWLYPAAEGAIKTGERLCLCQPQRQPLTDEHGYLLDALRTIAEGTYDVWSNGAQAQRTAIAAIEKYEAAHGIVSDDTICIKGEA
jgi:DNA repair exonuclease SbcCD ATPase subunit